MKNFITLLFILLIATLWMNGMQAQNQNPKETFFISGTRFTYPLIQAWIEAYKKANPNTDISILPKGSTDIANLKVISYKFPDSLIKENQSFVHVARYALLPVANAKSPLVKEYASKGLSLIEFENIFFSQNGKWKSQHKNTNVYTREQKSCAPIAFASHFDHKFSDIQGIPIPGDDKALLQTLQKDSLGISYNNLAYLYDVSTRKPLDNIAILPLDLNNNGKIDEDEKFYNSLDEVINKAEIDNRIITENVNIIYDSSNTNETVKSFISFILKEGQQFNHLNGFLNLDQKVLAEQIKISKSFTSKD